MVPCIQTYIYLTSELFPLLTYTARDDLIQSKVPLMIGEANADKLDGSSFLFPMLTCGLVPVKCTRKIGIHTLFICFWLSNHVSIIYIWGSFEQKIMLKVCCENTRPPENRTIYHETHIFLYNKIKIDQSLWQ